MKNKLLIPFFVSCFMTTVSGQLRQVSFNDKIDQSTLIVEGRVVEKRSYSASNGDIFTANTIQVIKVLKGDYPEKELTVTTYGGESNGFLQTWTHMLTLNRQDYGVFCLEPTRLPNAPAPEATNRSVFEVYSGLQGFLKFHQKESKAWVAADPFNVYRNIDTDIFKYISQRTGKKEVIMSPSLLQNGIRYHFRDMDFDGVTLRFNIYVNSLIGTKSLYKANIQFEYNDFFGSDIASNPTFLQDAGISLATAYDLGAVNLSSQKAQMELLTVGSFNQLTSIGTDEQLMAKGAIPIQNLLANPSVIYDLPAMQSLSKYYENGLIKSFETVLVEGEWGNGELLSPKIVDFFPKVVAAGIKDTLTIIGSDFGSTRETSRIQFFNAHAGESPVEWVSAVDSHYVFWSDTLIKVLVPSICELGTSGTIEEKYYAGTGKIRIRTGGWPWQMDESVDNLTVKFCAANVRTIPTTTPPNKDYIVKISNVNTLGGYSLYYAAHFKNIAGATKAFERALSTWRCATLVHFSIRDSATIPRANACRIDMAPLSVGVVSTLASTVPNHPTCVTTPGLAVVNSNMTYFSMSFNELYFWHTSTAMPPSLPANTIDMESVALHELGHAHLLKHSNNHNDLMYFTNTTPPYRRSIGNFGLEGGLWVVNYGTIPINTGGTNCKPPMVKINPADCVLQTKTVEVDGKPFDILIFPTLFEDRVTIKTSGNNVAQLDFHIFNTLGQIIQTGRMDTDTMQIILEEQLPVGIYYLTVQNPQQILLTQKIIKK